MPSKRVGVSFQELSSAPIVCSTVNEMDLGEALRCSRALMNVMSTEITTELKGFLDGELSEVLVSESWKTPSVSVIRIMRLYML